MQPNRKEIRDKSVLFRTGLLHVVQAQFEKASATPDDVACVCGMLAGIAIAQASGRSHEAMAENIENHRRAVQNLAMRTFQEREGTSSRRTRKARGGRRARR